MECYECNEKECILYRSKEEKLKWHYAEYESNRVIDGLQVQRESNWGIIKELTLKCTSHISCKVCGGLPCRLLNLHFQKDTALSNDISIAIGAIEGKLSLFERLLEV